MVKDIVPGQDGSFPSDLVNVNGILFFTVDDSKSGANVLWKSDGTAAGTRVVRHAGPGVPGSVPVVNPANLTVVNDRLFFTTPDAGNGVDLWTSDGTMAEIVRVKDIHASDNRFSVANFTAASGMLFFTTSDSTSGTELWKSDGTTAGTSMLRHIRAGGAAGTASRLRPWAASWFSSATTGSARSCG
jgi:ELWxxDGT repeat protein